MTLVSNIHLTRGVTLLCACAAIWSALAESAGRVASGWQPAVPALLAAMCALCLIAYPTWGEPKNPGLSP